MKIFQYKDYDEYLKIQKDANKAKGHCSYTDKNSLEVVCKYLFSELNIIPTFILCHGTRTGHEQKYIRDIFKKLGVTGITILGTEIGPTAATADDTIEWDFHEVKPEWLAATDIVYSNSFDHTPKPEECLDAWMSCVKENGVCVIEYSSRCDTRSNPVDPFGATLDEYKEMITKKYDIVNIVRNDKIPDVGKTYKAQGKRHYIIIKHRPYERD